MATLKEQLILHEGVSLKPYRCPAGKLTVGVGRNLDDVGISEDECNALLDNDIASAKGALAREYRWYGELDPIRKRVIIDMMFNLGATRFRSFRRMISALAEHDYATAAVEMADSRWYHQVGQRSKRLVEMMRTGQDYDEG